MSKKGLPHSRPKAGASHRRAPELLPRLRDRVRLGVRVLFVGVNPGIRTSLVGHHFAGYSNRFWKLLHGSGLVSERVTCEDDVRLPEWGYGITNLISRPTPGIAGLKPSEYQAGRRRLMAVIRRSKPEVVALVGVTLYRALFPKGGKTAPVRLGLQADTLGGARVFVLPNPSGRNANFTYAQMLAAFRKLTRHLERQRRDPPKRFLDARP